MSVNGVVVDGPNELLVRGRAVSDLNLHRFCGARASDVSAEAEAAVDESELTLYRSRRGASRVSVNGVVRRWTQRTACERPSCSIDPRVYLIKSL